jgi:hypothetical protein
MTMKENVEMKSIKREDILAENILMVLNFEFTLEFLVDKVDKTGDR